MRTHSDPALTLQTQNIFRLVRMAKGAPENFSGTAWPNRNMLGFQLQHLVLSLPIQRLRVETAGSGWWLPSRA
jgi:hypothetical protein